MAGIKAVCERLNSKATIYLGLDIEWAMDEDIAKGRKDKITLTQSTMHMLKPLLMSQSYIAGVESFQDAYPEKYEAWCNAFKTASDFVTAARWYQQPDNIIDLDKHHLIPINLRAGNIFRYNFQSYPDMACDLSKHWIEVPANDLIPPETIIINRTERCQIENINYSFLKQYEDRLLFAGHKEEWKIFCSRFDLKMPLLVIDNFLDLAVAIRSCSFFIGNQSLCFSLAEAMKVPRILEICPYLPNVIPCGEDAYDFSFQSNLEWYLKQLADRSGYHGDKWSQTE